MRTANLPILLLSLPVLQVEFVARFLNLSHARFFTFDIRTKFQ